MAGDSVLTSELNLLMPMLVPWAFTFALAMARMSGVLLALPHTLSPRIPRLVKGVVAVSLAASLVVAHGPTVSILGAPSPELALASLALGDFIFGLAIGLFVHVGLAAVRLAGEVCGVEMGLSFAAVADPMSQDQTTPIAIIFGQVAIQAFFAMGLDRDVLYAVAQSVNIHPLGQAGVHLLTGDQLALMGTQMFRTGLQIAMPLVGALFALKLSIALLARVAPKIQLFVLSFALTILLGHVLMVVAMPAIGAAVASHLTEMADQVTRFALMSGDG